MKHAFIQLKLEIDVQRLLMHLFEEGVCLRCVKSILSGVCLYVYCVLKVFCPAFVGMFTVC